MVKLRTNLTAERLREVLSYDPETGIFTRLQGRCCGKKAGSRDRHGYIRIDVDGLTYLAHRLAWLYVHGVWPEHQIDHKSGNASENRIDNLRPATPAQNQQNRKPAGCYFSKKDRVWYAQIRVDKKTVYLGSAKSKDAAAKLYLAAKKQMHTFQPDPREL